MLQSVRLDCQNLDDDARWLMSLTSDTVMRLSETCRLLVSDIHFDLAKPFVDLTEHLWPEIKIESSRKPRWQIFRFGPPKGLVRPIQNLLSQDIETRTSVT